METVTLSSKGQLVIPKAVRESAHLSFGDELAVSYVSGEIRLRPVLKKADATLDAVAGCLARPGRKKLSEDALAQAIARRLKVRNAPKPAAR